MQKVINREWRSGVFPYWLLTLACGHVATDKTPNGRYAERKKCKQCEQERKTGNV
jgi:hypothetical protein